MPKKIVLLHNHSVDAATSTWKLFSVHSILGREKKKKRKVTTDIVCQIKDDFPTRTC